MKKIIATLAGIAMLASAVQMPVSAIDPTGMELPVCSTNIDELPSFAIPIQKSEHPDYDLYERRDYTRLDRETGVYSRSYSDEYYTFDTKTSGTSYTVLRDYSFVRVTTDGTADLAAIGEMLGEETDLAEESRYYQRYFTENQYLYNYQENADYSALYQIDGVEKVDLVKRAIGSPFDIDIKRPKYEYDEDDNLVLVEDTTGGKILIRDYIKTEHGVELTQDMFADTGFYVTEITKFNESDEGDSWTLYYEYNGLESFTDFDPAVQQIAGVTYAHFGYLICEIAMFALHFDTVEPAAEPLTGDMDGNGVLDINDAQMILSSYAKAAAAEAPLLSANAEDILLGDVNHDGQVDIEDAKEVLTIYANNAANPA